MIYDRERQICGTRLRKLEKLWLPGMGQNVSICSAPAPEVMQTQIVTCLLYTSDAADDLTCVDLGGPRIIKKKKQ